MSMTQSEEYQLYSSQPTLPSILNRFLLLLIGLTLSLAAIWVPPIANSTYDLPVEVNDFLVYV